VTRAQVRRALTNTLAYVLLPNAMSLAMPRLDRRSRIATMNYDLLTCRAWMRAPYALLAKNGVSIGRQWPRDWSKIETIRRNIDSFRRKVFG